MSFVSRVIATLPHVYIDSGILQGCTRWPGGIDYPANGQPLVLSPSNAARLMSITAETPDPRTDGTYTWADVRVLRDALLAASDFTVLPDSPFSEEVRLEWKAYRAALRAITDQPSAASAVWPTPPV